MVSRFGMSFIMPSVMSTALKSVTRAAQPAGGAVNFIRQLGSLGTNFYVVLLSLRTQFHSDASRRRRSRATRPAKNSRRCWKYLKRGGVPEAVHQSGRSTTLVKLCMRRPAPGFPGGFLIIAAVFLAAMMPAWILGRAQAVRR